jgi:hypothetical protein
MVINGPSVSVAPVTCQEIARNQHGDLVLLAHDLMTHRHETDAGRNRGP